MAQNERVIHRLSGNGLVMTCTEKPGGLTPWWWSADEGRVTKANSQTYRHRERLRAYGCRWSKKRSAWYYIGSELPEEIAALVGPQDTAGEPVAQDNLPVPAPPLASRYSQQITPSAAAYREAYQARILRQMAEQCQATLERLTRYPALPAVATIRLDDPWA